MLYNVMRFKTIWLLTESTVRLCSSFCTKRSELSALIYFGCWSIVKHFTYIPRHNITV